MGVRLPFNPGNALRQGKSTALKAGQDVLDYAGQPPTRTDLQALPLQGAQSIAPVGFAAALEAVTAPRSVFVTLRALGLEKLRVYRWRAGEPLEGGQEFSPATGQFPDFSRLLAPGEVDTLTGRASLNGAVIEADLALIGGRYRIPGTETYVDFAGLMVETVLVEAELENRLVLTELNGSDVDQIQRTGSRVAVTIRGRIVDPGNEYPDVEVNALLRLAEAQCSIQVVSDYLNNVWCVDRIAIRSLRMPRTEAQGNEQVFEITGYKDRTITGGSLEEV